MLRKSQKIITVTPAAASFATPYTANDVIGGLNTISEAALDSGAVVELSSLTVLDKNNTTGVALDIFFFDTAPANTFGADNAAFALNDADLAKCLGFVKVVAGDYSASSANTVASIRNIKMLLQSLKPTLPATGQNSRDIYCIVVARGGITLGSATDLLIRLGIDQS